MSGSKLGTSHEGIFLGVWNSSCLEVTETHLDTGITIESGLPGAMQHHTNTNIRQQQRKVHMCLNPWSTKLPRIQCSVKHKKKKYFLASLLPLWVYRSINKNYQLIAGARVVGIVTTLWDRWSGARILIWIRDDSLLPNAQTASVAHPAHTMGTGILPRWLNGRGVNCWGFEWAEPLPSWYGQENNFLYFYKSIFFESIIH
jgi:hypothetical protein